MGQKVNPIGLRVGMNKDWKGRWYSGRHYREYFLEDLDVRRYLHQKLKPAGLSDVVIERKASLLLVTVWAARPGIVIGHRGRGVEQLRKDLEELTGREVHITVNEAENPELDAQLVAENVAQQIERRVSYRRAMRQAVFRSLNAGALGIKVICSGRLAGIELARDETVKEGKIPLHTLRADIDYGFAEASTKYGNIGVKVWLYRGDVIPKAEEHLVLAARAGRTPALYVADSTEIEIAEGVEKDAAAQET